MKKIIVLTTLLLFLTSMIGTGIILPEEAEQQYSITVSFETEKPTIQTNEEFSMVTNIKSNTFLLTPGNPKLPKISKTIILPFKTTINSIEMTHTDLPEIITLEKKIQPNPIPQPTSISYQKPEKIIPNPEIYDSSTLYPKNSIDYVLSTGLQNDEHVSFLTINWYPIQYNPFEDYLEYTSNVSINITYSPPIESVSFPNTYDLVIIAPEIFSQDLTTLVDHKATHGVETLFKSTEEIYQQYTGRDNPEQIKYFIKDAVESYGIESVLLIGNIDLMPMRRAAIRVYHDNDILTDLYYADIFDDQGDFSSWDSNNNDKFSEYNWDNGLIDVVDLYPDVYIGRLPCKNNKEVKTMVDKIITYENTASQGSWYQRLLLMAGDTFPNHGVIEGELVTNNIANMMADHGFEAITLWTSKNTFDPITINRELSKGAGFVSYSGHGYEQGFGTSPPNVDERIEYFSPYLIGVFNKDKLPVVFFDACSTTKLDFNVEELHDWYPTLMVKILTWLEGESYEMDNYYPCITWQIVKKINGGAIASIGSTRVAFTGVNEDGAHWGAGFLNTHFFEAYQPGASLASLFTSAQTDYLNTVGKECITLEEFTLIGDPSLHLGGYP